MIVFEIEPAHGSSGEAIFAGNFHNENTEVHAWSQVEGVGHYRWLHSLINHLPWKQQLEYITETMCQIFDFLGL